ncbi:MAG: DUF1801 domain-containing protein [Chloroflexota bacterium]|nr:DUF1801 domain-containing protein [Chloroflexota bacterium]
MATAQVRFTNIDEYVASCPAALQDRLETLRQAIRDEAPGAEEAIKYHMPTYMYHGNLVYFAAWKKHISLYPITSEMEATIAELDLYATSGKGTIQFPHDQPLPLDVIRKIVKMRVTENLANSPQ